MILMTKIILKRKLKTNKSILWVYRVKPGKGLILIDQGLCIGIDQISTGDNLLIIIQIVIDRNQTQECKAPIKEHKAHSKHQRHLHIALDIDVQIIHR